MVSFWGSFSCLFSVIVLALFTPISTAQLTPSETRILFQVEKLLEYPQILQGWSNWTNFCYIPQSPSLKIVCNNNRVTELTIVGNRSSASQTATQPALSQQTLSKAFSTDSLFTVVTKLSNLKALSLVSLGIWGPLPGKINRLKSLEVLNISSNFISGQIPTSVSSMKSLKSLVLADNLFNGSVPDLKSLTSLEELNIGNNNLGPGFPSIANSLVSVVLRNNSFRSEIPSQLVGFDRLQRFDINANNFVGPIPASLFSLPSIQFLNLANNQLSGGISGNTTCNSELEFVDISNNLLIGKLPSCIASNSVNRTVLYTKNCLSSGNVRYQRPYSFCHKEALAVKPPGRGRNKESNSNLGLIIAIIGGIIGIVLIIGLLMLLFIRRTNRRRADNRSFDGSVVDKISLRSSPRPHTESRRVPQTTRLASFGLAPYRVFTSEEIEDMTNNFDPSNLVGESSQGKVFKGWLRDGSVILVKCLKLKQKHVAPSLLQSIEAELPKLRHRHLISLLGHCIVTTQDHHNTSTTIFVLLEHVSNGCLSDCITDWRRKELLKWPQRLAITIGVARGVQFLHTGVAPGIFGNNIKISNVLLDDSLSGKISSYNIPLPPKVGLESPLHGQSVHLDRPENGEKEDIYQLGIILLEVITGKLAKSTTELNDMKLQLERGLSDSNFKNVVEPSIHGSYAHQSMKTAIEITLTCLCQEPTKRPSIEDVLWHLQYSMQVQEGWTSSGNLSTQM